MSLSLGDIDEFLSERPEAGRNLSQDPSGVFMVNRIKALADSASRLSFRAQEVLPAQPMRWAAATAETTARYDMWHEIDQEGYRQFTSEGFRSIGEAVQNLLADIAHT